MAVYLLAQQLVAVDPMADITPKALAAASACFTGCMSGKGLLGAIVYLLCQGSGGGFPPIPGSDVLWIYWESAHVDDNPPADPTKSVMRRFFNGDVPVIWNPTLAAWL